LENNYLKRPKGSENIHTDGKIKVTLSRCVTKHHAMKMYGGVEV